MDTEHKRQYALQDRIRQDVLAELHASGGLAEGRLSLEFLYLVPKPFIDAYVALFWQALHEERPNPGSENVEESGGGVGKGMRVPKQKSGIALGSENRLQATGGKRYKTYWTVRDEKALRKKQRIDTKLREMARDIRQSRADLVITTPPCGGCGKFMQLDWRFCPSCGNNLSTNR